MVEQEDIKHFGKMIAEKFSPEKIILFGSYAYGKPTNDSDVDILVIMEHSGSTRDAAISLRSQMPCYFPLDLLVRSPAELDSRLRRNDFFMKEILEKGLTIYERGN